MGNLTGPGTNIVDGKLRYVNFILVAGTVYSVYTIVVIGLIGVLVSGCVIMAVILSHIF